MIDIIHNPHIVKYNKSHLVLLDLIVNDWNFYPMDYDYTKRIGETFGFEIKEKIAEFDCTAKFIRWMELAMDYSKDNEGWVIVDANNKMYKVKTAWYVYWRNVRRAYQMVQKDNQNYDKIKGLCGDDENIVFKLYKHAQDNLSIPQLREILNKD